MWQLTEEQINHGQEVLDKIEDKIGIKFPNIDDESKYLMPK